MSVSVSVPEELYQKAVEIANAQRVTVDTVFASAFAEQLSSCQRLQQSGRIDAGKISLTERPQLLMRGDSPVGEALLHEVLPKLRPIAMREPKRERYVAPLSKTELIHEVWLGVGA